MRNPYKKIIGVVLAVALAGGGIATWSTNDNGDPPIVGSRNVWVDSNGGSCDRSSSPVAYVDATACASFAAVYDEANTGDTIGVVGSLGDQYFAGGAGAAQGPGTKTLTFYGEPGNKIRAMHIGSPNMTFDGLILDADGGTMGGGAAQFENGGESFTFKNGSIGDTDDSKGALIDGPNATFDNVDFHDIRIVTEGVHTECIQAYFVDSLTIRDSSFTNCAIMDLSMGYPQWWDPLPPAYDGVILEGNSFGTSRVEGEVCCAAISLAFWATKNPIDVAPPGWDDQEDDFGEMNNFIVRNNFLEPGSTFISRLDNVTQGTGNTICGNTGDFPSIPWKQSC